MAHQIIALFEDECARRDCYLELDINFLQREIDELLDAFTGTSQEALKIVSHVLTPRPLMNNLTQTQLLVNQLLTFCEVFTLQGVRSLRNAINNDIETIRTLWVRVRLLSARETDSCPEFDRRIREIYMPIFESRALDMRHVQCAADSLHAYFILVSTWKFPACPRLLERCRSASAVFDLQRIQATLEHVFEVRNKRIPDISFVDQIVDSVTAKRSI
jgi:hypothetical protein